MEIGSAVTWTHNEKTDYEKHFKGMLGEQAYSDGHWVENVYYRYPGDKRWKKSTPRSVVSLSNLRLL